MQCHDRHYQEAGATDALLYSPDSGFGREHLSASHKASGISVGATSAESGSLLDDSGHAHIMQLDAKGLAASKCVSAVQLGR